MLAQPTILDDTIALAEPLLVWLDYIGIAVFAASGALAAARMKQTFVTFAFFAFVTGVGGGTVRDLLIGAPVFWIGENLLLASILMAAVVVWFFPPQWNLGKLLAMFDGAGLAVYSVFGASKAMSYGIPPLTAIAMGIFTASIGGVIRDVLAGQPSIIMSPGIYISASALTSSLFVGLTLLDVTTWWAAGIAGFIGLALRCAAIEWNWALPRYNRDTLSD